MRARKTLILALFLLPVAAFADIVAEPDAPLEPQEFTFTCEPYKLPFKANSHYLPSNPATCFYTIPQTAPLKVFNIYKGEVGNAELISSDLTINSPASALRTFPNSFGTPSTDDTFFTVVYGATSGEEISAGDMYFQTGGGSAPAEATILHWQWGPKPAEEFDPVIIIPGILGSWEKNGEWVLDPITHIYDNLTDTLLANGYTENETLFKFPYDWHNSNVLTAELLKEKIETVKEICQCSLIDIVAHSMGGLVTAQYLKENSPHHIDQATYIGTPFAGSPDSYKTWEGAEIDFGDDLQDLIMQRIFSRDAKDHGFSSLFEYIQEQPIASIQELLPLKQNYLYSVDTGELVTYPRNEFLEELDLNFGSIDTGVQSSVIVGNMGLGSTTIGFRVQPSSQLPKWEHGQPIQTLFGAGDGTVPSESATYFFPADISFEGLNHTQIVSKSAGHVFNILNKRNPETIVQNIYDFWDIDFSILIDKLAPSAGDFREFADVLQKFITKDSQKGILTRSILLIILYSPIDIQVTAPDGKITGTSITSGAVVNEIPDAIYSGPAAKHEFVIIPDPNTGEYDLKTKGTGNGTYTITAAYIDLSTTTQSKLSGSTTLSEVIDNTLTLSLNHIVQIQKDETKPSVLDTFITRILKASINRAPISKELKEYVIEKIDSVRKEYPLHTDRERGARNR